MYKKKKNQNRSEIYRGKNSLPREIINVSDIEYREKDGSREKYATILVPKIVTRR